jgi:hypothetical protein
MVQRRFIREIQNLDVTQKRVQRHFILLPSRRPFDTEQQFRFRNYGNTHITDWDLLQPF